MAHSQHWAGITGNIVTESLYENAPKLSTKSYTGATLCLYRKVCGQIGLHATNRTDQIVKNISGRRYVIY